MPSSSAAVSRAAGRIVGVAEQDGSRAVGDEGAETVEIRSPPAWSRLAVMILAQVPVQDVGLQPAGEAAHLHVIRHHHDHVVARLDQQHQRDAVRLGSAVGDLHVRRGRAWIHRRDQRAELEGSVGLGIAERLREQRHAFILGVGQLLDAQRMHAAFRQVPADAVLPCRLEPLHLEGLELHSEKSTSRSVDRPATEGSRGNRVCGRQPYSRASP